MNRVHIYILCLIIFLGVSTSNAQSIVIKGNIVNVDSLGVYNVKIISANDSVAGNFTTDHYSITLSNSKPLRVVVSSKGYKTKEISVEPSNTDSIVIVPPIYLDEYAVNLNEIVVTAKMKIHHIGTTTEISNVHGSYLGNSGSLYDMLSWTPGLMVRGNNTVQLVNGIDVKVYINGRPAMGSAEITAISSDEVSKIEIIRDPGAKYSTSVPIVNITLRKRLKDYFGLNISDNSKFRRRFSNESNLNLAAKFNHLSINTALTYDHSAIKANSTHSSIVVSPTDGYESCYNQKYSNKANGIYLFSGVNYEFSQNSNLLAQYTLGHNHGHFNSVNDTKVIRSDSQYDYAEYHDCPNDNNINHNFLLGLTQKFNNKAELSLLSNYSIYKQFRQEYIFIEPSSSYEQLNNINNRLFDFEASFSFSKGQNYFDIGINSDYIFNKSITDYDYSSQMSKRYDFMQATYISYRHVFKKFVIKAEARYEYNYTKLNDIYNISKARHSNSILPFVQLIYNPTENSSWLLGYRGASYYPTIQELNPNISYVDSLHYTMGNPELERSRYDRIWLSYTFKNLNVTATYRRGTNAIVSGIYQENGSQILIKKPINAKFKEDFELAAEYGISGYKFSFNALAAITYSHIAYKNIQENLNNTYGYLSLSGSYRPFGFFELFTEISYRSPFLDSNMKVGDMWNWNLGARLLLLQDRLRIGMQGHDILHKGVTPYWSATFNNISEWQRNSYDTRGVYLQVQYLFSINPTRVSRKSINSDASSRL